MESLPNRAPISKDGILTVIWHRFLTKLFQDFEKRISELEATSSDHETRITALEP